MNYDEPRHKETKQCFLVTLSILIPPYESPQKHLCSHSHQNCFVWFLWPALGISVSNQGVKPHPCSESTEPQPLDHQRRASAIILWSDTYQKMGSENYAVCPVKGAPKVRTWIQALKLQSLFSTSAASCLNLNLSVWSKSTCIKQTVTGLTWTVWKYTSRTTQKN